MQLKRQNQTEADEPNGTAVAVAGEATGVDIVEDEGEQVSLAPIPRISFHLEIRKVDSNEDAFKGMTLKKKDEDEELGGFFGGGKSKKKKGGNKKSNVASGTATPASEGTSTPTTGSGSVNLPMSLLSALLSLGIPPPSGKDDVQRTIDDLETKKAWFEANSAAKTKVSSIFHRNRS